MITRRSLLTSTIGSSAGAAALAGTMVVPVSAASSGVYPNLGHDQSRALQKALDKAAAKGGALHLDAGIYVARELKIRSGLTLTGVPGKTRIVLGRPADQLLSAESVNDITLSGVTFEGAGHLIARDGYPGLLRFRRAKNLTIENCTVKDSAANGISLDQCSGRISHSTLTNCLTGGIFSMNAKELEISHNHVHDIGDNGILVWQSAKREDGTIVTGNRIERIFGKSGGDGPYGNGIIIFRAGSVTVSNNRITDCQFSAIRNNSGDNVIITGNNCARMKEVAIFVEFAYDGAVVSDNLIEKAGLGISITNFNDGGRLAVCANNVIRDMTGPGPNPETQAVGIHVEADANVSGNIVENASRAGLWLGWGPYLRDISATSNIVRNCGIGITLSMYKGARNALVANNMISNVKSAIRGMDHDKPVTGDLAKPGAKVPRQFTIVANQVTRHG